mmetsp:Transcript_31447/g.39072  ORF Transcript_31447/g.39072 Transcript_31447/m.39072 type:complete len:249 (-) Transcript_31447:626-1372(-)
MLLIVICQHWSVLVIWRPEELRIHFDVDIASMPLALQVILHDAALGVATRPLLLLLAVVVMRAEAIALIISVLVSVLYASIVVRVVFYFIWIFILLIIMLFASEVVQVRSIVRRVVLVQLPKLLHLARCIRLLSAASGVLRGLELLQWLLGRRVDCLRARLCRHQIHYCLSGWCLCELLIFCQLTITYHLAELVERGQIVRLQVILTIKPLGANPWRTHLGHSLLIRLRIDEGKGTVALGGHSWHRSS